MSTNRTPMLEHVTTGISTAWRDDIGNWQTFCAAAGHAPTTLRMRTSYLRRLAATLPLGPWHVTIDELAAFLSDEQWAPETRKVARSAIQSFYAWAHDTERIEVNPSAKLRPIRIPPARPRPAPEVAVLRALNIAPPRERLMVLLGAFSGLRRAEIATLHTRDLVDGVLRVRGKGGRVRLIPAHPFIASEIGAMPSGYVFPGAIDGHLSPNHVGVLVKRSMVHWSAHKLRHRFASKAYEVERDIRAVQELLGHASVVTTQIYTAVPDGALERAVAAAGRIAA